MEPGVGAFAVQGGRRRGWLAALAIVAGVLAADPGARAQSAAPTSFDVPAGPLSRALATFGRQAGVQVTYLTDVCAGKTSLGISGPATAEDALARILKGTGLIYSFPNATTVAVSKPPADVDGALRMRDPGAGRAGAGSVIAGLMAAVTMPAAALLAPFTRRKGRNPFAGHRDDLAEGDAGSAQMRLSGSGNPTASDSIAAIQSALAAQEARPPMGGRASSWPAYR